MFWSWTLPWNNNTESLLGILIAEDIEIIQNEGDFSASLVSVGLLFGRVDFIFNLIKKEE